MQLTAWITLAALFVYMWTFINVGRARGRFKINAPVMEGPPEFLSVVRVHLNTLEQIPLFLVPLWMSAYFTGDRFAAICGALWCVGRIMYALGYYQDPAKRSPGFLVSSLASIALILGTMYGLLMH
ncbi:MAG: MAPEG family protein [Pseudomonadota bacterium]